MVAAKAFVRAQSAAKFVPIHAGHAKYQATAVGPKKRSARRQREFPSKDTLPSKTGCH